MTCQLGASFGDSSALIWRCESHQSLSTGIELRQKHQPLSSRTQFVERVVRRNMSIVSKIKMQSNATYLYVNLQNILNKSRKALQFLQLLHKRD